jgi:hypothetical protein
MAHDQELADQLLRDPDAFVERSAFGPAWAAAERRARRGVPWGAALAAAAVVTFVAAGVWSSAGAPEPERSEAQARSVIAGPEAPRERTDLREPAPVAAASSVPHVPSPPRPPDVAPPPSVPSMPGVPTPPPAVPAAPTPPTGTLQLLSSEPLHQYVSLSFDGVDVRRVTTTCGDWIDQRAVVGRRPVRIQMPSGVCELAIETPTSRNRYQVSTSMAIVCTSTSDGFTCAEPEPEPEPEPAPEPVVPPEESPRDAWVKVQLGPGIHATRFEINCGNGMFRERESLFGGSGRMYDIPSAVDCHMTLVGAGTKKRFRFQGSKSFTCNGLGSDLMCR